MKDIVKWLLKIEHKAGIFYNGAAEVFKDEPAFAGRIRRFAEDEAWHYHAMASAASHLVAHGEASAILLDPETRLKIEAHFDKALAHLSGSTLTRDRLLDFIINTEFSEWNDIFLFVVNTLKKSVSEFKWVAAGLQTHKRAVEYFIEQSGEKRTKIDQIMQLDPVWQEKILIIEDDEAIAELLKAILIDEGIIEMAENGREGLEKIKSTWYRLILSDIDMPVMDGLECFSEARRLFPAIASRYLFFTGDASLARISFFNTHQIAHLQKPAPLNKIRQAALNILLGSTRPLSRTGSQVK